MKNFWIQSVAITVFIFFLMWSVSKITDFKLFNAFDPISQALADFELTDYAFSRLRPDPLVDQRIVLVNFGELPRREVSRIIRTISQYKPRVIGVDSYYTCEGGLRDTVNCPQLLDEMGNLMLANAIEEAGNVVLASKLLQTDSLAKTQTIDGYDSVEYSDPMFRNVAASSGYANLVTEAVFQEDVKLCRKFIPRWNVRGHDHYAFAVELVRLYDSMKVKKFLARGKEEEIINYRGNVEIQNLRLRNSRNEDTESTNFNGMFYAVDVDQILNGKVVGDIFRDNIVIVGFLGKRFGDIAWEDKYFTPLNKKIAGRANPDMFGIVVHANIVAMILNEDYVEELAPWQHLAIAFIICLFTVALFIMIDRKLPIWFDAFSVFIQVIQLVVFSGLMVWAFAKFSFKLDLSLALAAAALVGPGYDIFKSFQMQLQKWYTKRNE
jgi:CHASE2 domain-containing sensor protein